jgi:hypothetical protein
MQPERLISPRVLFSIEKDYNTELFDKLSILVFRLIMKHEVAIKFGIPH